ATVGEIRSGAVAELNSAYGDGVGDAAILGAEVIASMPLEALVIEDLAAGWIATKFDDLQDAFKIFGRAEDVASTTAEGIGFARRQLQHAFKHAKDFGVNGTANNKTLAEFSSVIQGHITSSATRLIQGSYRGQKVTHFVDPSSRLNVMRD